MDVSSESVQEAMVSEALVHFKATLQAAVREVQVDVRAFKQRIEQRIEELCFSNRPLAGAVSKLQEENLQLRAKLEALSRLVEGLAGVKMEKSPAEVKGKKVEARIENGHVQTQSSTQEVDQPSQSASTCSDASGSSGGSSHVPAAGAPNSTPTPPPWRTKRHADINVSARSFNVS